MSSLYHISMSQSVIDQTNQAVDRIGTVCDWRLAEFKVYIASLAPYSLQLSRKVFPSPPTSPPPFLFSSLKSPPFLSIHLS